MTTYFAGAGIDAFFLSPTQPFMENGRINVNYGKWMDGYVIDPATNRPATGLQTLWTHFVCESDSNDYINGRPFVTWFASDGQEVVRLVGAGNSAMYLQYRKGADWVSLPVQTGIQGRWNGDVRIDLHPTQGRLQFYVNQQFMGEWTGLAMSAPTLDLSKVRFSSQGDRYYAYYEQIIFASYNTIGHTVRTRRPRSEGASSAWGGTYGDVNEDGLNDSTAINTATVGALTTYGADQLSPTIPGNVIKAVTVAARIRNSDEGSPRNARAVVRVAGINRVAPKDMQISPGFVGATTTFDVNPATGARWATVDELNGEFGLQATE